MHFVSQEKETLEKRGVSSCSWQVGGWAEAVLPLGNVRSSGLYDYVASHTSEIFLVKTCANFCILH